MNAEEEKTGIDIWEKVAALHAKWHVEGERSHYRAPQDAICLVIDVLLARSRDDLWDQILELMVVIESELRQDEPQILRIKMWVAALIALLSPTFLQYGPLDSTTRYNIVVELERQLPRFLNSNDLLILATQQQLDNNAIMESTPKNANLRPRIVLPE